MVVAARSLTLDQLAAELRGQLADVIARLEAIAEMLRTAPPAPHRRKLLTIKEAAAEFNVSEKTLYRMRPPMRVRIGRAVRINREAMERWIALRSRLDY